MKQVLEFEKPLVKLRDEIEDLHKKQAARPSDKLAGQIADLEAQVQSEVAILESGFDAQTEPLEEISLRPKASDITVQFCGIAWLPFTGDERGNLSPAL